MFKIPGRKSTKVVKIKWVAHTGALTCFSSINKQIKSEKSDLFYTKKRTCWKWSL